ncbi:MAG: pyrroline-5-carboxylate reductase [Phycisphaerae bacterium]|nr:pyrroline-5-carboxylate reductase [Phycisphaerae bacterium]MDW8261508.1 pyrroline-5-carboxylate reductase [Phycisphaerales bacterium]
MNYVLAFLGAGNIAEAIATAVLRSRTLPAGRLIASDPATARRAVFAGLGIDTTESNATAAQSAEIVMLCVKPQMMASVLEEIAPVVDSSKLIVSVAAGISTRYIADRLGKPVGSRVIRVMPNTPLLVGAGATALCKGGGASDEDLIRVRTLLQTASSVVEVTEDQMDAVTAVSGSGPAYFFFLVEQMIAAGAELGLSEQQARQLVYQTAFGAARMLQELPQSPAELRRRVTSPGGTTQAAMEVLESANVGKILREAIAAAWRRGRELGR